MPYSVLQSASGFSAALTAAATFTTANLSSGTKLVAFVSGSNAMTISSVKDGSNNSFSQVAAEPGASAENAYIYVLDTPAGDVGTKPTITVTWTGTANGAAILIWEVSGLAAGSTAAAVLDGTAGKANGSAGTTSYTATLGSYASAAAGELLVVFYSDAGGATGAGSSGTTPSGYSADANNISVNGDDDLRVYYKDSTGGSESPASLSCSQTVTATMDWQTIFVAFKLAGGAAAAPPAFWGAQ